MKKLFISILVLLPALTMQAQTVLTPQQQLEKAQKDLEEAKKALEAAEAAKTKAEAEKMKAEAEKIKAEAEKVKAEAAKTKAEANKTQSQQTKTTSGWAIPTAEPKKAEVKKENAQGVVIKTEAKYLDGAVTINSEGKVEFTLDTDANGKSADEIYNIVYQYMSELTQGENNIKSRMALVNKDQHIIANTMDEWLVFSNSFISLDRTEFKYNLVASIKDNHLTLTLERLNYIYEEDRSTGFKAPAEKVITDKYALNKKKTNLAKIFGKFRRLTIDRKDQIFNDLTALVKQ